MTDETRYDGLKVVVTGADGFIGSHLTELLVRRGATVTAMCLYNSFGSEGWLEDAPPEIRAAMDVRAGDVRDPHFMQRLLDGADVVFHLAALIAIPYSYTAPRSYSETNVLGTVNVLEACRAGAVGRVVHTSTSEVYGTALFTPITECHPLQAQSPYSASKIGADCMVEAYARSFGLPAAILRPFNTFGPRQSERAVIPTVIRQALQPDIGEIRLGDLTPVRDFNYVEDIARAFLAIGCAEGVEYGRAYNAGTGVAIAVRDVVARIQALVGGAKKPIVLQSDRLRPAASEVMALVADAERFRRATGWTPVESFDSGLERTIAWWREVVGKGCQRRATGYLV